MKAEKPTFPLNAWYAAAYDVELGRTLVARTVCKQKIVMFRKLDGTVAVTRWMENIDAPPFWAGQIKHSRGYEGKVDRWQIINFEAPCTVNIDVGVAETGSGAVPVGGNIDAGSMWARRLIDGLIAKETPAKQVIPVRLSA